MSFNVVHEESGRPDETVNMARPGADASDINIIYLGQCMDSFFTSMLYSM